MNSGRIKSLAGGITLLMVALLTSCTVTEKAAVRCPDFSDTHYARADSKPLKARHLQKRSAMSADRSRRTAVRMISANEKAVRNDLVSPEQKDIPVLPYIVSDAPSSSVIPSLMEGMTASTDNDFVPPLVTGDGPYTMNVSLPVISTPLTATQSACDTLVLNNGSRIPAIIVEMGSEHIRYRECGNPSGPIFAVMRSVITEIKFSQEKSSYITVDTPPAPAHVSAIANAEPARIEGLAIAGFTAAVVGLLIAGIPLGAVAIIFGGISLAKIKSNPSRFKGKGLGITAVILGIIDIVGVLIFLAAA